MSREYTEYYLALVSLTNKDMTSLYMNNLDPGLPHQIKISNIIHYGIISKSEYDAGSSSNFKMVVNTGLEYSFDSQYCKIIVFYMLSLPELMKPILHFIGSHPDKEYSKKKLIDFNNMFEIHKGKKRGGLEFNQFEKEAETYLRRFTFTYMEGNLQNKENSEYDVTIYNLWKKIYSDHVGFHSMSDDITKLKFKISVQPSWNEVK